MKSRDFVYWLQGYFEIAGENATITKQQEEIIKKHLAMVFIHEIDPSFGKDQEILNEIHNDPNFSQKDESNEKTNSLFVPRDCERKRLC